MLNKYTIIDNFDKLDLMAAASKISDSDYIQAHADDPQTNQTELLDKVLYGAYNETIYTPDAVSKITAPYSFTQAVGSWQPDLFRYITNKKFYINKSGDIQHTNDVPDVYFGVVGSPMYYQALLENSLFKQNFFFDIQTPHFARFISNNSIIYKNDLKIGASAIDNYFLPGEGVDLVPLNVTDTFIGYDGPFMNGFNRNVFRYDKVTSKLMMSTLWDQATPIPDWLREHSPTSANSLIFLLHRLLFPYKTPPNALPKHVYFVSNLRKAIDPEQNSELLPAIENEFVSVTPTYNRYLEYAESKPSNVQYEWQLPNAYAYYSFLKVNKFGPFYKYYGDIVKLGSNASSLADFDLKQYYEFSNNSNIAAPDVDPEDVTDFFLELLRQRTIVFGETSNQLLKNVDSVKDVFPYFNQVGLPPINSPLVNKLQELNLLGLFTSLVGNYFSIEDKSGLSEIHTFALHNKPYTSPGNEEVLPVPKVSLSTMQILDLSRLNVFSGWGPKTGFFQDNKNIKLASSDINQLAPPQFGADLLLKETLKNYYSSKTLTFDEIDKGKNCYSELLAFEVVKYRQNSEGTNTRLQSFFIPCVGDEAKTLLDTQIFYNKEYVYEVFAISLVVGASYTSELGIPNSDPMGEGKLYSSKKALLAPLFPPEDQPQLWTDIKIEEGQGVEYNLPDNWDKPYSNTSDCWAAKVQGGMEDEVAWAECTIEFANLEKSITFEKDKEVQVAPRAILVRAPYYNNLSLINEDSPRAKQKKTILIDKPPLAPDVSFYPYKDVDNKVLIMLNINYGERKLFPIEVFPEDAEKISKYKQSQQNLNLKFGEVLYRTDDYKGTYEVYRTTIKPKNWQSFSEATPVKIKNQQSSAFEDKIAPNVDYYYFARFADIHGNISNPTGIFHLRMVKEGGFPPYMVLKSYSFKEGLKPPVYEKKFKKYLKIELAEGTRDYFNLDSLHKANFGYKHVNSSTPLKKYKIRVTSKKTGKRIDINVDFTKIIKDQYLNKNIDLKGKDMTLKEDEVLKKLKKLEQEVKISSEDEQELVDAGSKTPDYLPSDLVDAIEYSDNPQKPQ